MLGLNDLSSMRYSGSLAHGVNTKAAAVGTLRLTVGDPSQLLIESGTVNTTTVELPGHDASDGRLVDGMTFTIKNTMTAPSSKGATYKVNVNQYINSTSQLLIILYEQDAVTLTYSEYHDEWFIMSRHNAW